VPWQSQPLYGQSVIALRQARWAPACAGVTNLSESRLEPQHHKLVEASPLP